MKKSHFLPLIALGIAAGAQTIDISGTWRFAMGDEPTYNDSIDLPASMLTAGKGNPVTIHTQWVGSLYDSSYFFNPRMAPYRDPDNIKFPFFLTPDKHYVGNAWYERDIEIPADWNSGHILLELERPHIETTVFINGTEAGRDSSLSVPHRFDITPYLRPGETNTVALRIYNGIENVCVGQDSHSVTDQTQGDWNGVVGEMKLTRLPETYIENLQIYPDVANQKATVRIRIAGNENARPVIIEVTAPDGTKLPAVSAHISNSLAEVEIPIPSPQLWSEHNPALYSLTATLGDHTVNHEFGMRDIEIRGRSFYLNGQPLLLRGTVGNCCFPLTGYPPTDVEEWTRIFNICRDYGLNCMRFHSYCPPEAAFIAADRVGFYLQPEGPSWPNHGVKLGNGMSIDRYLYEETERMVDEYGNHPSFCMLAAGNEPAGNWVKWCNDFCERWRESGDNRRVYCGASVGGGWAWDSGSDYHVKGGARGLDWDRHAPQSEDDYYAQITSYTQRGRQPVTFEINEPFISHEQGQWCAFPDLTETDQYTGAYKARNFEIFADLLADAGMQDRARDFLMASGNLQTLAYKYEIERNLRTPEYAGFVLLGLNDYSGQGTALVGVLNVFWREKGYCTADDWSEFCSPVVPLARFPKFVFTNSETAEIPLEVYNALDSLQDVTATAVIESDGAVVWESPLAFSGDIPLGKNNHLPAVNFSCAGREAPAKYTLTVKLSDAAGTQLARNHWDFWIYPDAGESAAYDDVYETDSLDSTALARLAAGGKVLLKAAGKVKYGSDVKQTYLPVFWNTSWFKMRPPHTTGAAIDTDHPLFARFPSDNWGNLNWWELLNGAQVINMAAFPADYQSPVQPIDTWHISRKLGMLVEANVGGGKLLMTTMDIDTDLDNRPVARQMRKAITEYMHSDDFQPVINMDVRAISDLYEKQAPAVDMFTNESPDELKPVLK